MQNAGKKHNQAYGFKISVSAVLAPAVDKPTPHQCNVKLSNKAGLSILYLLRMTRDDFQGVATGEVLLRSLWPHVIHAGTYLYRTRYFVINSGILVLLYFVPIRYQVQHSDDVCAESFDSLFHTFLLFYFHASLYTNRCPVRALDKVTTKQTDVIVLQEYAFKTASAREATVQIHLGT